MSEKNKRSIQFRRNRTFTAQTAEEIKTQIVSNSNAYVDGEIIFGRYYAENDKGETGVATLIGLVEVGDTGVHITFIDAASMNKEITIIEKSLQPTDNTDAKVENIPAGSNIHKNIISITSEGIEAFADIHYDKTTNKLKFINTNGYSEIDLNYYNFMPSDNNNIATSTIHNVAISKEDGSNKVYGDINLFDCGEYE